ncbi:MAG: hypothetical protein MMC33_003631 [Icmadophila ericetorum]|nr:hypothetical protein [Icmadophila ericetorum]
MVFDEKEVIGAQVISANTSTTSTPEKSRLLLPQTTNCNMSSQSLVSGGSSVTSPSQEHDHPSPGYTNPCSAFYSHPTTRTSFEQLKIESKTHIEIYEKDLELGTTPMRVSTEPINSPRNKDCSVWPGQERLLQQHLATKRKRGCHPMRNLSKQQKLFVKLVIAVLIVGGAIGIGIGISKAVGAGVWKTVNTQAPIG